MSKTKSIKKLREGVYSLGKEKGTSGSNVFFYTKSKMGTYGTDKKHMNNLGEIRTGRVDNPNGIIAVAYALSKESYFNNNMKSKIRTVIRELRKK